MEERLQSIFVSLHTTEQVAGICGLGHKGILLFFCLGTTSTGIVRPKENRVSFLGGSLGGRTSEKEDIPK